MAERDYLAEVLIDAERELEREIKNMKYERDLAVEHLKNRQKIVDEYNENLFDLTAKITAVRAEIDGTDNG